MPAWGEASRAPDVQQAGEREETNNTIPEVPQNAATDANTKKPQLGVQERGPVIQTACDLRLKSINSTTSIREQSPHSFLPHHHHETDRSHPCLTASVSCTVFAASSMESNATRTELE